MPTYLVTGGAGFIGSHLVEGLLRHEPTARVRVLDNLSTGNRQNLGHLFSQIDFLEGDCADVSIAAKALRGIDVVFHQAALASVPRSVDDPLATHAACATATLVMLDQSHKAGVRRFVYAASSSAYGDSPKPAKQENDPPNPLSPYAAAKLAGEHYCQAFFHSYGLETVSLRYFNVFGPRQNPNGPYAAVIPKFSAAMRAGEQPVIFGDGRQSRDFTYVENVVRANLLAMTRSGIGGRTYNIATGQSVSLLKLIELLNQILGTRLEPRFEPPRPGDVRDSLADISAARRDLGYQPAVDLVEGLRLTAGS